MTAGAAQPCDAPGVDDLDRAGWKQHQPHVGRAVRAAAQRVAVVNHAIADGPGAVLDEAAVTPVPADAEAARPAGDAAPALDGPSRLLPAILDGMGDGLIVADEAGRYLYFNAAARRILGVEPTAAPLADRPLLYGLYRPADGA